MIFKRFLLSAALLLGVAPISAQDATTEVFNPHWFMQFQGGIQHTLGEAKFKDLFSPNAAISLGYKFSPAFGIRANANGWQSKGGWVNPTQIYKFNYLAGNIDMMFDLSSLLYGFNAYRTLELYAFAGGGLNLGWNNDEAQRLITNNYTLEYLWKGKKIRPLGRAGMGLNIRLSDAVKLNFEVNANILSDKYNSKKAGNADWYFNGLVGVSINLGKGYKTIAPIPNTVQDAPTTVTEQTKPAAEEAKPVVNEDTKPIIAEEFQKDIFFEINSCVIRKSEQNKINDLVSYMKKYPNTKVVITGYADAATGNANINQKLSKCRADVVTKALKNAGIDASRIVSEYKGDTVQPYSSPEKNRVSICIVK